MGIVFVGSVYHLPKSEGLDSNEHEAVRCFRISPINKP